MAQLTREQVLNQVLSYFIKPKFKKAGYQLTDKIKVSVGIPKSRGNKAIGQCWTDKEEVGNGFFHIFVSPELDDLPRVIDVLMHECIHTKEFNHKAGFAKIGKAVGLKSPWTATTATDELKDEISQWIESAGIIYPHIKLNLNNLVGKPKKQSTRMVKLECECGYIIRTSRKNVAIGLPTCCCGKEFFYDEPV